MQRRPFLPDLSALGATDLLGGCSSVLARHPAPLWLAAARSAPLRLAAGVWQ